MPPLIRRFTLEDAAATRQVFWQAVREGAASRYSAAELQDWVADPAMPEGWGEWLDGHITLVSCEDARLTGFFMVERSGYLNMAFVAPDRMGTGTADALYQAILAEVRPLGLKRLTVLASRHAQGFFRRRGWQMAPEIIGLKGLDPRQGPGENPVNRPMALTL